jgi:hypothetical protein
MDAYFANRGTQVALTKWRGCGEPPIEDVGHSFNLLRCNGLKRGLVLTLQCCQFAYNGFPPCFVLLNTDFEPVIQFKHTSLYPFEQFVLGLVDIFDFIIELLGADFILAAILAG